MQRIPAILARSASIGFLLIMITSGTLAQANDNCEPIHLTMATESGDQESVLGKAIKRVSDLVKRSSDGCIDIKVFYQGQLGGPQELFDQLMLGNIDLMLSWPHTSYDERLSVLLLPYLALDWNDALATYGRDGWLSKLVHPIFADNGLKYLGPFPEGFGGVATRGDYATTFDAARHLKVRSAPIFPLPQTLKAMGYQAVPIDWSETYTSIQTGVVDGDSSNVIYWDYTYFRDLLDYYVHTKHNFSFYAFLMNQNSWQKLDQKERKLITAAIDKVVEEQFSSARAEDQKWINKAQKAGIKYIELSNDEMAALVHRVRRKVWSNAESSIGKDIMDNVRKNAASPD